MKELLEADRTCHWYTSAGEPRYDATLRHARKEKLFPSVTSVCGIYPKPALETWKQEQLVLAALTLPKVKGEPPEDRAKRVIEDAKAQTKAAAEWGIKFHALVEAAFKDEDVVAPPEMHEHFIHWLDWAEEAKLVLLDSERIVVNPVLGYAGRLDFLIRTQLDERPVLTDIKTRGVKNGKPLWYDEQIMQLVAYGQCMEEAPRYLSIVINRDTPETPYLHWWTDEAVELGWKRFQACLNLWKLTKNYEPKE